VEKLQPQQGFIRPITCILMLHNTVLVYIIQNIIQKGQMGQMFTGTRITGYEYHIKHASWDNQGNYLFESFDFAWGNVAAGQGGNSGAMWDFGGTVTDLAAVGPLAIAGQAKQDVRYLARQLSPTTGRLTLQQAKTINSFTTATKTLSYARAAGSVLGGLGLGMTIMEGMSDGNMSGGDWAKVGFGVLTLTPRVGWAIGLADLGMKLSTGQSISDRIGLAIDKTQ